MARFRLSAIAAIVAALPAVAAAEGLFLHHIPTTRADAGEFAAAGTLRIRAFARDLQALAAAYPDASPAADGRALEIVFRSYPQLSPRAPNRFRASSFLIDYDEPELVALGEELLDRHGATPSLGALRGFVSAAIPDKELGRGWDTAARVARSGVGDCTEHAVLLAALARRSGRPARVVAGLLLLQVAGEPQSYGHAWAEIHEGDVWRAVDATPVGEAEQVVARIPLVLVRDEGPGYALSLAVDLQRAWARRVEVVTLGENARAR